MINLILYNRPGNYYSGFQKQLINFSSWRRTSVALGGCHIGKLALKNSGMNELSTHFNNWLGLVIEETTYGIVSYEGIIWQLDLIKNGVNYRRTLNSNSFRNRVRVDYTDANFEAQSTAWGENISSSDIYGEMEYIFSAGDSVSTGAIGLRDRELREFAWPSTKVVGNINVGQLSSSRATDGLYITTLGLYITMNWRYYESAISNTATSLISTLVGASEFVNTGRIETNSLTVRIGDTPIRLWDLIKKIIAQGDDSSNLWKGGTYGSREFTYEPVPTTIEYNIDHGRLTAHGNYQPPLSLIRPGFYVRDLNAPIGYQPPGTSNIWDAPQVLYCNELEFIYPNSLILKFPGEKIVPVVVSPPHPDPVAPPPPSSPPPSSPSPSSPPPDPGIPPGGTPYTDQGEPRFTYPGVPPPGDNLPPPLPGWKPGDPIPGV